MAGTIKIVTLATVAPTDPEANPTAKTGMRGVPIWAKVDNAHGFAQVQWSSSNGKAFFEQDKTPVNLGYAVGVIHLADNDTGPVKVTAQLIESGVPGATDTSPEITFTPYGDASFTPYGSISASANVALSNMTAGPLQGWDQALRIDFALKVFDDSLGPISGAQVDWVPDPVNTAIRVFQGNTPSLWIGGNNSWSTVTDINGETSISMFCRSPKMITLKATTLGWEEPTQNTVFFADFYQITPSFTSPTVVLNQNGRFDLNGLIGSYELDLPLLQPFQTANRKAFAYIKGNRTFVPYFTLDATKLPQAVELPIAELDQKNKDPNANMIVLFTQDVTGNMASSQILGFATDGTSPNVPDPAQERVLGAPSVLPDPGGNGTINNDQLAWYDGIKAETPKLDPAYVKANATLTCNFYLNGWAGGGQVGDMISWPQGGMPVQPNMAYDIVLPKQFCTGYGAPPDGQPWGYCYIEYIVKNADSSVYYSYYPQYRMST